MQVSARVNVGMTGTRMHCSIGGGLRTESTRQVRVLHAETCTTNTAMSRRDNSVTGPEKKEQEL